MKKWECGVNMLGESPCIELDSQLLVHHRYTYTLYHYVNVYYIRTLYLGTTKKSKYIHK